MLLAGMDKRKIQKTVKTLLDAAPGSRIILFGSHARGEQRKDSDIDLLVIEPRVKNRFEEMARLSKILGKLLIPADVMVVSERQFSFWRNTPNTLIYRALKEGILFDRVA